VAAVAAAGAVAAEQPADPVTETVRVVFTPSGRQGAVAVGTTVLEAARRLGVDLDTVCGGRGICGRCQVVPEVGEFAKHGLSSRSESLSPAGPSETTDYRGRRPLASPEHRLGCHAEIVGDLVVDVPPESQVHRQVVRKRLDVAAIEVDPVISLHYIEVSDQNMDEPRSELDLVRDALQSEWQLTELGAPLTLIRDVQAILTARRDLTVAVRDRREIVAAWPGFHDRVLGVAIDVGSTTVAGHLLDLDTGEALASAGRMNPQIRFGEDLMSRVSFVMMNAGGEVELTTVIRSAIDELIGELADEAGMARTDVLEVVLVGNPIMHHLLLGLDSVPLGGAPFALATDAAVEIRGRDLDLDLHHGARVYVLPCIAGHVGADTAGAILSERPDRSDDIQLLVDVGTNAEIVLGNKRRLLAASSPTGPAFEGAQISSGQRATIGAIERIRIDPVSLEPRFKVLGADVWSDEPGFADQVETIPITGICGSGIIEAVAEMMLAGIISRDGVIDGSLVDRTPRIQAEGRTFRYLIHSGEPDIHITQNDVRAIQLAKAALYAGIRLLMDHLDIDQVDSIRLAGAFGSHIDPVYAMALGLVPDCDLTRVSAAGNAAGTGAVIALLSGRARREIEALVPRIDKIETATQARFQDHFVDAMAIPHAHADYPNLSARLQLPSRSTSPSQSGPGRRRRRRSA